MTRDAPFQEPNFIKQPVPYIKDFEFWVLETRLIWLIKHLNLLNNGTGILLQRTNPNSWHQQTKKKKVAEKSRDWISPKKTLVQGLQESKSCSRQLPVSRKDKTMRMTEGYMVIIPSI